jgi:hypothetical protein
LKPTSEASSGEDVKMDLLAAEIQPFVHAQMIDNDADSPKKTLDNARELLRNTAH